ncbi:amino acid permease [Streptomyces sp. 6N106]|uniref:amino acid permease n=1 Tax=Streptomyces sp. 6N106 TaxID=3457418 RepID=UPI003FCF8277
MGGSPFVMMLSGLGIGGAATVLNIVVLTATLSVFNTMAYSNARVLHSLAQTRQAPAFFARTNGRGVPVTGLLINSAITGVVVLLNYFFPGRLLMTLVTIVLCAEIVTWDSIAISHLRFRKLGQQSSFKSPFHPFSNYLSRAYFALIVGPMTQIPDFRDGAIALPLWVGGLILFSFVQRKFVQRPSREEEPAPAVSGAEA